MSAKVKNLLKIFLGFPLTLISFYFIASFIFNSRDEVLPHLSRMNPLGVVLGLFFLTLFFLFRSLAWHSILVREGHDMSLIRSSYLLAVSEIKRYIPGSVIGFLSRINNFATEKVPSKTIVKLIFYESIVFLTTSAVLAIPGMLFVTKIGDLPQVYILALISVAMIALIIVTFFLFIFSKKYSGNIKPLISKIPEFYLPILYMFVAWIFFGIGNFILGSAFYSLPADKIIELSSLFILTWIVGYVVIIVPLGLGVREAAVVYGLSSIMSAGLAAVISIILRVGFTLAELIFLLIVYSFERFKINLPHISKFSLILWSAIVSYIAYFSYYSTQKHLNFFTGRFDLGNMDQTVWNTVNGRIFELTNPDGVNQMSRLGVHADFILVLLSPFYLIWEDPQMLLVIQSTALGIGGYVVYKISDVILPEKKLLALSFAISYLLNPWLQKQNLYDFHAVTLATPLLLAAFYFLLKERLKFFIAFLLLAMLTKENLYLIGMLFGLYLYIKYKKAAWLVMSLIFGLAFYIVSSKIIPALRGTDHFALQYFSDFGNSLPEIALSAITNPVFLFSKIFAPENIEYLSILLLPVGFLSIFAPYILILATPEFMINLLSSNANLRDITFHYAAVLIPFVYVSAILGAKNISRIFPRVSETIPLSIFILLFSVYASYNYGILPGSKNPSIEIFSQYNQDRIVIKNFLDRIPLDIKVAATNEIGAHLSQREYIYVLPQGLEEADLIIIYLNPKDKNISRIGEIEYNLQYDERYIQIVDHNGFSGYAKKDIASKIPDFY